MQESETEVWLMQAECVEEHRSGVWHESEFLLNGNFSELLSWLIILEVMIVWAHSTEHNERAHKQVLIHLFLLPINFVFPNWSVSLLISAVINRILTVNK